MTDRHDDDYVRLGEILLHAHGREACLAGYLTDDPYWVGRYGLGYGDIDQEGNLT